MGDHKAEQYLDELADREIARREKEQRAELARIRLLGLEVLLPSPDRWSRFDRAQDESDEHRIASAQDRPEVQL